MKYYEMANEYYPNSEIRVQIEISYDSEKYCREKILE